MNDTYHNEINKTDSLNWSDIMWLKKKEKKDKNTFMGWPENYLLSPFGVNTGREVWDIQKPYFWTRWRLNSPFLFAYVWTSTVRKWIFWNFFSPSSHWGKQFPACWRRAKTEVFKWQHVCVVVPCCMWLLLWLHFGTFWTAGWRSTKQQQQDDAGCVHYY